MATAGDRRRGEDLHCRPAFGLPPVMVSGAQAPAAGRPLAAGHQAPTPAEDRIGGIEGELPARNSGRAALISLPGSPGRAGTGTASVTTTPAVR